MNTFVKKAVDNQVTYTKIKEMKENTYTQVRTFNKKVREMLAEVDVHRVSYYNDLTNDAGTRRRKIFKFGPGGRFAYQKLNEEAAKRILAEMNKLDSGWLPWNVSSTCSCSEGVKFCEGFYKREEKDWVTG